MSLWTRAELEASTGGGAVGDWSKVAGIAIDSRQVMPGDLFVALVGPNHDAHGFVADALGRGAAAAMVHAVPDGLPDAAPLLRVGDTLEALAALGRAGRGRARGRIAAVTGSVGKTGTKEALRHVLGRQASVHASVASFNNHWGVPLSLARLPADTTYGVFELGMNHPGELTGLSRLVRPHVALITTIAAAHLAQFATLDAIADAKAEILAGLEPAGVAVLNRDIPQFERLRRHAEALGERVVTFGTHEQADWRAVGQRPDVDGSDVRARGPDGELRFRVGLPGGHWVMNSMAVLAVVACAGADAERAAADLADLDAIAGRGQRRQIPVPGGTITLIDDSYNANPASVAAGLAVLGQSPGRKIAVLGDMLELGEAAQSLHEGLAEPIRAHGIDLVFTVGSNMAHLGQALDAGRRGAHADTSDEAAQLVLAALRPGDTVLVKGSFGSRMGRVVAALTETVPATGR